MYGLSYVKLITGSNTSGADVQKPRQIPIKPVIKRKHDETARRMTQGKTGWYTAVYRMTVALAEAPKKGASSFNSFEA
jgi:hypothetical protein